MPELDEDEFTLVVVPDTQHYANEDTDEFADAAQWIADHAADTNKNIQMVMHVGDVAHEAQAIEYDRAGDDFSILENNDIPYLVTTGNHDYGDGVPRETDHSDADNYRAEFTQARLSAQDGWNGAFYEENRSENAYWLRTIGGNDYIFMVLEAGPRDAVLTWALGILNTHSGRDAILVTHSYMYRDGTRTEPGDSLYLPDIWPEGSDVNGGEEMWDGLVKLASNIVLVVNGHDANNRSRRQDDSDEGNLVSQILFSPHQDGYIRLIAIKPTKNEIHNYTYSPHLNQWSITDEDDFVLDYKNVE